MAKLSSDWPAVGELEVCTITKLFQQGAFVSLDEYGGKEGMVHISEVASGWIKNIRDYIKEGQKVVCRVLAVDPDRKLVDLSIRRVKDSERRWKTERLKLERRAEKLLELAAKKIGKTLEQAYEEVGFALQEKFGDLYTAVEAISKDSKALLDVVKDEDWVKVLSESAAVSVKPPEYAVRGQVSLNCPAPNGVEVIRSAIVGAREAAKDEGIDVEFYYIGSPKYRIDVSGPSYKAAESALKKAADLAIGVVVKAGGKGEFQREAK